MIDDENRNWCKDRPRNTYKNEHNHHRIIVTKNRNKVFEALITNHQRSFCQGRDFSCIFCIVCIDHFAPFLPSFHPLFLVSKHRNFLFSITPFLRTSRAHLSKPEKISNVNIGKTASSKIILGLTSNCVWLSFMNFRIT